MPAQPEARNWALFADWCASLGLDPLPTTAEIISDFLRTFPASIKTQGRRVRAIRRAHERAGLILQLPTTAPPPRVLREGPNWAPLPRALAQIPKYSHRKDHHVALRGRRDAWLLVLVGTVGLTRRQAREITQQDVAVYPQLTVKGVTIPKGESPVECPSCAVTRWLRVVGPATFGWWGDVKDAVDPLLRADEQHDCTTGLDGTWRQASTLLPAIDRHGWVSRSPMSTRAISTAIAQRQTPGAGTELPHRTTTLRASGRFADATPDELAEAYDDVDERAAALLMKLKDIVGETSEMLGHIKSLQA